MKTKIKHDSDSSDEYSNTNESFPNCDLSGEDTFEENETVEDEFQTGNSISEAEEESNGSLSGSLSKDESCSEESDAGNIQEIEISKTRKKIKISPPIRKNSNLNFMVDQKQKKPQNGEMSLKIAIRDRNNEFLKSYPMTAKQRDEIRELDASETIKLLLILKGFIVRMDGHNEKIEGGDEVEFKHDFKLHVLKLTRFVIYHSQNLLFVNEYVEVVKEICLLLKRSCLSYAKIRYLKGKVDFLCGGFE